MNSETAVAEESETNKCTRTGMPRVQFEDWIPLTERTTSNQRTESGTHTEKTAKPVCPPSKSTTENPFTQSDE